MESCLERRIALPRAYQHDGARSLGGIRRSPEVDYRGDLQTTHARRSRGNPQCVSARQGRDLGGLCDIANRGSRKPDVRRDPHRIGLIYARIRYLSQEQTRANVLLGLEDSAGRAGSLAQCEMVHGRQIPVEESLANLAAVTVEDIQQLAVECFQTDKIAFVALGDLDGLAITRDRLTI